MLHSTVDVGTELKIQNLRRLSRQCNLWDLLMLSAASAYSLLQQKLYIKIKGEMEVARRRGRRRKKLLDDLKDRRGYSHLKEALHRTIWRHRFGGGFRPVVRQNIE